MNLYLISFGKLRTPGLREAADYYARNLRPWVAFEEIELKSVHVPDKSPATRARIQAAEAALLMDRVERLLPGRRKLLLLDESGRAKSTHAWAEEVRGWEASSLSGVAFCIGSSLGFADSLKKSADGLLSLGPQTLSHELARVVLLEQLYRSWSVVRGHPYHNEG